MEKMNSSWPLILESASGGQQSGEPQTSLHTLIYIVCLESPCLPDDITQVMKDNALWLVGDGPAVCLSMLSPRKMETFDLQKAWSAERMWRDQRVSGCLMSWDKTWNLQVYTPKSTPTPPNIECVRFFCWHYGDPVFGEQQQVPMR